MEWCDCSPSQTQFESHVDSLQVVSPGNLPRDSNLSQDGERINPHPWKAGRTDPEHTPLQEQANPSVVQAGVIIMQLNKLTF